MNKILLGLLLFIFSVQLYAQQTIDERLPDALYQKGLSLYNEQSYHPSAKLFSAYQSQTGTKTYLTESSYYLAMIAFMNEDNSNTSSLESFAIKNRNHPLASLANFHLGNDAFEDKNYSKTLAYYDKVSIDQLGDKSNLEFLFKRGYANMIKDANDLAVKDFKQVSFYKKDYYLASVYYAGLIYSNQKKYTEAMQILEEADGEKGTYEGPITELIANNYYQTSKFDELIAYAQEKLTEVPNATNRTLHRLVGETYFERADYKNAAKHLQRHLDFSKNKMDAIGYYKLGFSYYKIGDKRAIENFKLAALEGGDLGQSSSFYLGKLYLDSKNYQFALRAFESAIVQGGNESINEDSQFLVGKINYTLGQYANSIDELSEFSAKYPKSKWSLESSELLTQSYLKTSDYQLAITHIESLDTKTKIIKEAYQSLCFHNAQLFFNDANFEKAIIFFKKSNQYPIVQSITAESYYLLGESYYLTRKYPEAKIAYENCRKLSPATKWTHLSLYGLGYIAYNEKDYASAKSSFYNFTQLAGSKNEFYVDAKIRLADCEYVQKNYNNAILEYKSLLGNPQAPQDYINYQLGITYSLNNQSSLARSSFEKVMTIEGKSAYKDNALFQKGESFIADGLFRKAIEDFSKLIATYPESPLVPYSYSKRASCHFNLDENQLAKEDYDFILKNYISSPVANGALFGLQELIKRGLEVPEFDSYMEAFRVANPDDSSLEVVAFEAAKNKYYNQQYSEAILSFNTFERKYPESSFQIDIQYFIADSYYRLSNWSAAANAFEKLITPEANAYKARALDKRGKSLLANNEFQKALNNYRSLLRYSSNRKEQFIALEGIMNTHYNLKNMDSTIYYSDQILKGDWKPIGIEESVWLLKGKALIAKGNYEQAIDELVKVLNGPLDEKSAEAKYNLAFIFYKQENYKQSLESLFQLNKNYGSYSLWIGESFLLIADNYIGLEELLQAKATLQSIVDNSAQQQIVARAKSKLLEIEQLNKKRLIKDTVRIDTTNEIGN